MRQNKTGCKFWQLESWVAGRTQLAADKLIVCFCNVHGLKKYSLKIEKSVLFNTLCVFDPWGGTVFFISLFPFNVQRMFILRPEICKSLIQCWTCHKLYKAPSMSWGVGVWHNHDAYWSIQNNNTKKKGHETTLLVPERNEKVAFLVSSSLAGVSPVLSYQSFSDVPCCGLCNVRLFFCFFKLSIVILQVDETHPCWEWQIMLHHKCLC